MKKLLISCSFQMIVERFHWECFVMVHVEVFSRLWMLPVVMITINVFCWFYSFKIGSLYASIHILGSYWLVCDLFFLEYTRCVFFHLRISLHTFDIKLFVYLHLFRLGRMWRNMLQGSSSKGPSVECLHWSLSRSW